MINQLKQQDIDLWEVWIEYDQFNTTHFGTLYVLGEVLTGLKSHYPFIVKERTAGDASILRLRVPQRSMGRSIVKEVLYSEPIENIGQYRAVHIYAGEELVAHINEIEVLI